MVAVVACGGGIAGPAVGIGRIPQTRDRKFERVAGGTGDAEVEPLIEIRFAVLADREAGSGAGERLHDDIAAVEGGVDADGNGTLIVRLDSTGKSLKKLRKASCRTRVCKYV